MQPVQFHPIDTLATVVFAILAAAVTVGALFTITRRNPVVAVMSLVGTFFALAGIFASLSAHFLAVLQVMVYAGAIMVLFIFVVMILNRDDADRVSLRGLGRRAAGLVAAGYVVLSLARVVWRSQATPLLSGPVTEPAGDFGGVAAVGATLFTDFVFPFEAISLLLLVAVVGGLILSRSHKQGEAADETARRRAAIVAAVRSETMVGGAPDAATATAHHGHH